MCHSNKNIDVQASIDSTSALRVACSQLLEKLQHRHEDDAICSDMGQVPHDLCQGTIYSMALFRGKQASYLSLQAGMPKGC